MDIYRPASEKEDHGLSKPLLPIPAVNRESDFMADGWRVFKIMAEFVSGFEMMSDAGPAVTVFGSTRVPAGSPEYTLAEKVGRLLAAEGFSVITGGGPGVMEAVNKGAQSAGGPSIGFNIKLPNQQEPNKYIDHNKLVSFQYFFVRKVMFLKYAQASLLCLAGLVLLMKYRKPLPLYRQAKANGFL